MPKTNSAKGWSGSVLVRAILSAACGSFASVFGKIAFDSAFLDLYSINNFVVKAVLIVSILLFNSVMLSLYVRVLQAISALQASLLSFVYNYVISTTVGVLLFGETISIKWVAGAMLMTAGAIRVSRAGLEDSTSKNRQLKKSK
jgi:drug/metabolite transporter (DMT)-like permease